MSYNCVDIGFLQFPHVSSQHFLTGLSNWEKNACVAFSFETFDVFLRAMGGAS